MEIKVTIEDSHLVALIDSRVHDAVQSAMVDLKRAMLANLMGEEAAPPSARPAPPRQPPRMLVPTPLAWAPKQASAPRPPPSAEDTKQLDEPFGRSKNKASLFGAVVRMLDLLADGDPLESGDLRRMAGIASHNAFRDAIEYAQRVGVVENVGNARGVRIFLYKAKKAQASAWLKKWEHLIPTAGEPDMPPDPYGALYAKLGEKLPKMRRRLLTATRRIIEILRQQPEITTIDLRHQLNLPLDEYRNLMKDLREEREIILHRGKKNGTVYRLNNAKTVDAFWRRYSLDSLPTGEDETPAPLSTPRPVGRPRKDGQPNLAACKLAGEVPAAREPIMKGARGSRDAPHLPPKSYPLFDQRNVPEDRQKKIFDLAKQTVKLLEDTAMEPGELRAALGLSDDTALYGILRQYLTGWGIVKPPAVTGRHGLYTLGKNADRFQAERMNGTSIAHALNGSA